LALEKPAEEPKKPIVEAKLFANSPIYSQTSSLPWRKEKNVKKVLRAWSQRL
jgi:hypothetical protein